MMILAMNQIDDVKDLCKEDKHTWPFTWCANKILHTWHNQFHPTCKGNIPCTISCYMSPICGLMISGKPLESISGKVKKMQASFEQKTQKRKQKQFWFRLKEWLQKFLHADESLDLTLCVCDSKISLPTQSPSSNDDVPLVACRSKHLYLCRLCWVSLT